jgi:parvulin-like peptidyl-prolyl isomerase
VLGKREERTKPLPEVREELETYLRQQQVQQQAIADARQIAAAVRNGSSLDEAAQAVNWQASELPLLARDQNWPVVGLEGADAAFRLPVGSDNQPTDAVSDPVTTPGGYVVLQVKEVSPSHTAEYDEVRVQALVQSRQQKAVELMSEAARQVSTEAQKGSLSAAARRHGFQQETSEFVSRLDTIPAVGPVSEFSSAAFSLAEGQVSPALQAGQNWMVFRVAAKQPPNPQGLELARADLVNSLNNEKRGMAWEIFRSTVRRRLEADGVIQINQAAMNTLLRNRR